ncbi:Ig-like domain-containing protein [uncultured Methanobrevibacter sp.]|uniref:Ig-like domain-containing protein n=1 Tax=uncultured Methanobrevibacter sp. TaxID=253161 RepID=UPI00263A2EF3|nr:Ig-like domain-containing protein [uncultured Methanobrevibacter sp.]
MFDGNKAVSGLKVTFKIKGKKVGSSVTATNGEAIYKLTQTPGTYTITASVLGKSLSKKVTVKHLVTLKIRYSKKICQKNSNTGNPGQSQQEIPQKQKDHLQVQRQKIHCKDKQERCCKGNHQILSYNPEEFRKADERNANPNILTGKDAVYTLYQLLGMEIEYDEIFADQ